MSNRTVQAAAEGMPRRDLGDLENAISNARMSAKLADYVTARATGADNACGDPSAIVRTTAWERDLVLFATSQASIAADAAMAAFDAFVEAGR
ncbi:hypothetical protein ACLNGM_20175 [Aureimonas phyllosphaerae]|uniref:hypothetical protein n=1 Tax=Aureimonas phyllosphaerae TaxID=1166078 RepID=UPI003A5BBC7F